MGLFVVCIARFGSALIVLSVILSAIGFVMYGAASTGPERVYVALSLLFAAALEAVLALSRKVTRDARPWGGLVQLALLAVVVVTFVGYFAYGRLPAPGAGYGMYGELKSGGPVFGVSVGMSREDAARTLTARRFHHVDSWCLAPGTFEVTFSNAPPHPTERDCKGGGIEDLWQADPLFLPLFFGEVQKVELHVRQGKVVHIEWFGGGTSR